MARNASRKYMWLWLPLLAIGLPGLYYLYRRNQPPAVIDRVLSRYQIPRQTRKYWIAVSAFETTPVGGRPWTSRVFRDSNNLFNVILSDKLQGQLGLRRLPYGEGQTVFPDLESSVVALYKYVIRAHNYPLEYSSLADLVKTMKQKGYYALAEGPYQAGAARAYENIYG